MYTVPETSREKIESLCAAQKAIGCTFIEAKSVVVGHWTRFKCQYGCGGYGKSRCCPPHSPTPDDTKKLLSDYTLALLIHFDGTVSITKAIAALEREIFLMNYYKVIGFGAGPCRLCKECNLLECKVPKLARPSMEACGIDVYATVRNNGLPINVLTAKEDKPNYYGLLLIE